MHRQCVHKCTVSRGCNRPLPMAKRDSITGELPQYSLHIGAHRNACQRLRCCCSWCHAGGLVAQGPALPGTAAGPRAGIDDKAANACCPARNNALRVAICNLYLRLEDKG